ncbi:hypothetical protein DICSQDRAFT_140274 [Dichomitus squalens LYAD-421 SS1]|uniref:PIN domain-like protein n=1 Tax=Dichomitus squalens (strain LYAD-421) TaxID=732165 RepID=R7SNA6_DICSQ|nr:uncharacterized protein DICSQDRAFT_140274 [Dichomitus squalens LYAD-421 SS1]EJF57601.1 hypothetical protein DICSQDRAFT_140274 [Dichomitus squalens LYAD-421 SS1]
MGVHGLTTYLRENKHILSRTVQLIRTNDPQRIPVVVDAWSFIYEIVYCADLPWIFGGEYPELARLVEHVVRAWVDIGLELHFVFDGPYPALKFPTLISRVTQTNIQSGLLFFRTSATARSSPRFLRETAMLPPLAYSVCVDTLLSLTSQAQSESPSARRLYLHFADEEGDPYAVALAARLDAYVAGRDSDFIVLNAEGYRGYIPLDEMVWTLTTASADGTSWDVEGSVYSSNVSVAGDSEAPSIGEDEDGFRTVRKGKGKKKRQVEASQAQRAGRGILPPDALGALGLSPDLPSAAQGQLALSFTVYSPTTLATHLDIPVSLLPLLGALLGNDFTGAPASDDLAPAPATTADIRSKGRGNLQRLFFERQLTLAQRISRVSTTLSSLLAAAFDGSGGGKRRGKRAIGSVMELIDAAVTALLIRPLDTFATGEKEAIVERIVEATLQYAVPRVEVEDGMEQGQEEFGGIRWASGVCPLHLQDVCPLFAVLSGLARERDAAIALHEEGRKSEQAERDNPVGVVRERYVGAFRRGLLDPHLLDVAQTGTMWPRMFLEDPDKETVLRSVGRPIRLWTYAILNAGIGLPMSPEPDPAEREDEDEESDEDELIDVVEEDDSDAEPIPNALARLRGALQQLDGSKEGADEDSAAKATPPSAGSTSNGGSSHAKLPKLVTEYVRRGTRLVPEEVTVPSLSDMLREVVLDAPMDSRTGVVLPPQIWTYELRRALLLRGLASDLPAVAHLPDDRLVGVVALRWAVRTMHQRSLDSPGVKERFLERWTQVEARAVLASLYSPESDPAPNQLADQVAEERKDHIVPTERHIQLVAQISAALDAIEQLSQVLLLSSKITTPARQFSGMRCHALLSGRVSVVVGDELWQACVGGLEDAYALPPQRRTKKAAKGVPTPPAVTTSSAKRSGNSSKTQGLFALLADAEA